MLNWIPVDHCIEEERPGREINDRSASDTNRCDVPGA